VVGESPYPEFSRIRSSDLSNVLPRLAEALSDRYRLERELGAGGMATVYLAQDIRHNRRVALKVLRPELAAVIGAERFLSEITTTANLQHPHILPLFDSGEADGFLFYVMPYVEGETLRDRISREKQLPVDESVRITTEVAAALDYAHRHGVVHRDIKPENILLHDGSALVADFGIALAVSTAGTRMTETGMSLGTPHYMSPEQAMGEREITARSDVYALGCVLYEMLTGDPPFTGSTAQAIVARVVTETPRPMVPQRQTIPAHVEAAVLTSLQKLPADRFRTAADFAGALADPTYAPRITVAVSAGRGAGRRWAPLLVAGWAVAAIAVIAALWGWLRPQPRPAVARYRLAFPEGEQPQDFMALSPDGSRLVYVGPAGAGRTQLWVKERNQQAAIPLPGTANAAVPVVSPDGQWVAFAQSGQVRKMPIGGGAAITLVDSALGAPLAWLDDGTLLYDRVDFRLGRVPEGGGPASVLWRPSASQSNVAPFFPAGLPGARGVVFTLCSQTCATGELWVLDLKSGSARQLFPDAIRGWYLPTGHLVYVRRDGGMFAVPFDLKTLETRGTPVPVLDNITLVFGTIPNLTFSSTGTLVMQAGTGLGGQLGLYELVWVDRTGREARVDSNWTFRHSLSSNNVGWSLSPDGKRLAIGLFTNSGDDIWIKELPTGPLSRLTFDSTSEERPRWTPDGKSVTYVVDGTNSLRQRPADGTGKEETLLRTAATLLEGRWSRDGAWIVARTGGGAGAVGARNVIALRPGVDSAPRELLASPRWDESAPALSPDGRWLAYASDETGRTEVYIRPFPNVDDGKWQVSANGGQAPLWAHSGRELFYVDSARNMMMAPIPAGPSQLGARVKLFRLGDDIFLTPQEWYTPFDIAPDDRRFIMTRQVKAAEALTPTFLLVENWFEEVKARVALK
jgi:eukaryotic-like serine/threonine-protein kinase